MNIFILDIDPFKSAQMLCNSHVVKAYKEYYKFKSKSLKRFNFTNRQNSWE